MPRNNNIKSNQIKPDQTLKEDKAPRLPFVVSVILIVLVVGFSFYYFFNSGSSTFRIENKYYGFELKAPKSWKGEENTFYSEENISKLLKKCQEDKLALAPYQIGAFRFQSSQSNESSAIVEVVVSCVPENLKNRLLDYNFSNLKIAGEDAIETVLKLSEFSSARQISFFHNNFEYKIKEYASSDKYSKTFDGIISSFKFLDD